MNKQKDYYAEIDSGLREWEECKPYHNRDLSWLADRIDWCWRWRRITEEQTNELANRVVALYNRGIF